MDKGHTLERVATMEYVDGMQLLPHQSKMKKLNLRLQEACTSIGINFEQVANPVSIKAGFIHMSFSESQESVVDQLIKLVRSTIAKFSPEAKQNHHVDDDKLIGILIMKSFIKSSHCWSLTICLSNNNYEMRETVQA